MIFDIITIFPNIFDSYFGESVIKRAKKNGIVEINVHNLREYTTDKHKTVDDTPYGGGAGMVPKIEPIYRCVQSLKSEIRNPKSRKGTLSPRDFTSETNHKSQITNLKTRVILFSAKGKRYTQKDTKRLAKYDQLVFICGRYEGVDERVAKNIADEEISIGDYVLTGGEIPAMAVIDSIIRLLPGVLGNDKSAEIESHSKEGYLEFPQYTKPEEFNKWKVPKVLLSGHHGEIEKWRKQKSKSD